MKKIIFTGETALMCKLFEVEPFEIALKRVKSVSWENDELRTIWDAMVRNRQRKMPHDIVCLFFELESEGEDLTRLMISLATEYRDFRFSTMSTDWMIDRAFGGER